MIEGEGSMSKSKTGSTILCMKPKITVADYRELVKSKNRSKSRNEIAKFLRARFTERYITPMRASREYKSGFAIMAVSCLMIEALESFRQGWKDSNPKIKCQSKGKCAVRQFFKRNFQSSCLLFYSDEFYKHIRCGILHQGETTGGWHIRRGKKDELFVEARKQINANLFLDVVEKDLVSYCNQLKSAKWEGKLWRNCRKKMNAVCKNCEPKNPQ